MILRKILVLSLTILSLTSTSLAYTSTQDNYSSPATYNYNEDKYEDIRNNPFLGSPSSREEWVKQVQKSDEYYRQQQEKQDAYLKELQEENERKNRELEERLKKQQEESDAFWEKVRKENEQRLNNLNNNTEDNIPVAPEHGWQISQSKDSNIEDNNLFVPQVNSGQETDTNSGQKESISDFLHKSAQNTAQQHTPIKSTSNKHNGISNNSFIIGILLFTFVYFLYLFYKIEHTDYKKESTEFIESMGAFFLFASVIGLFVLIVDNPSRPSVIAGVILLFALYVTQKFYWNNIEKIKNNHKNNKNTNKLSDDEYFNHVFPNIKRMDEKYGTTQGLVERLNKQANTETKQPVISKEEPSKPAPSKARTKYTRNDIKNINDWRMFEKFISGCFKEQGYKTTLTSATNDGGKDIIVEKNGVKTYIECKYWQTGHSIGRELIQKLAGAAMMDGVKNAIFITTSSYHSNAYDAARALNSNGFNIQLWDIDKLLKFINN